MDLEKLAQTYFEESYRYYITYEDNNISDSEFDYICKVLADNFEDIPDKYKEHLDLDSLKAGTGFSIPMKVYCQLGAVDGY